MRKSIYREMCMTCKEIKDFGYPGCGMMECISCKQLICIDCTCSENEISLFIETTGKSKIIKDDPEPDMNGPVGWVCPSCFGKQFGRAPKRPLWKDSPSSTKNPGSIGQKKVFNGS